MINKIKKALGSMRFYYLVIALVAGILAYYGIIDNEVADLVYGFTGVSILVRTADKFKK